MKQLLCILIAVFCLCSAKAEPIFYRASNFSYKFLDDNARWSSWSDWEESKILISIDAEEEVIKVYSEQDQRYVIVKMNDQYKDKEGGEQCEMTVVDQDGDVGVIRLRVQRNSIAQLYVEFENIMWVYSGLRPVHLRETPPSCHGAVHDINRAIALNPDSADAYSIRGEVMASIERHEEALVDFNIAIKLDPDNLNAYKLRGRCDGALAGKEPDPEKKTGYMRKAGEGERYVTTASGCS